MGVRPRQGCYVREVDIDAISDYYTMRVALESMTVELAIEHMGDDALRELAEVWHPRNAKKHHNDPDFIKSFEESFHIDIARGCGNAVLLQ